MPFDLVESQERLGEVANAIVGQQAVGLDIETTALRPWRGEVRLISLKTPTQHYVVDLFKTGHPDVLLRALEAEKSVVKIIQNAKFETRWFLHKYQAELWPIFDPFRASNLIYNGNNFSHDLHAIQLRELEIQPGEDLAASNWGGELSASQLQYSADDTVHLPDLRLALKEKLTKYSLNKVAGIEFGAVLPEAAIENRGFFLDVEKWTALYEKNRAREKVLRRELLAELPHPTGQLGLPGIDEASSFNLGSTQQLQKSLARLGIRLDSTRKDAISMLLPKTKKASLRALLNKLIEYKKVRKLCESFGLDYLSNIDPVTKRIHASYYPFTGAGRYACSDPNLQQLPRNPAFRECFRAEDGNSLGVWDYSQIELRIAAEIAQDARMLRAYRDGLDLHTLTAALLNDIDPKDVLKEMRTSAKAGNFGLCIAEGQRVLTHGGLVPIEKVQDWHLVWDGVEWVRHQGVVAQGVREVLTYDGLTATPDHEVWTRDGRKVPLRQAASEGCGLARTGAGTTALVFGDADDRTQKHAPERRWLHRVGRRVLRLWADARGAILESVDTQDDELCLSGAQQVSRSQGRLFGATVRRDDSALLPGHASLLGAVQGAWYPGAVYLARGLHSVGAGYVPNEHVQGIGLRSDRQQRAVLEGQSAAGVAKRESAQQVRVYDLLNAGPRRRFTCEGRLVSNCYGMGAAKFVVYAQSNYGVTFTEEEAQEFIAKFFGSYQGLQRWHRKVFSDHNRNKGYTRTLSGRLRYLQPTAFSEFANTPVQGTGADGLKVAMRLCYDRLKPYRGVADMVNIVHDEIVNEMRSQDAELQEQVDSIMKQCMVEGMQQFLPSVPVVVEGGWGSSWADK